MDAQTLSAVQSSPSAARAAESFPALPGELFNQLQSEFSHFSVEYLEQECRDLAQASILAALELGKRLLFLKEQTAHGNWLPLLQRIGVNSKSAQRLMAVAIRFLPLPNGRSIIAAVKHKTKLFELLVLEDDELQQLSEGASVRGVSLDTLPQSSVDNLRAALRDNAPSPTETVRLLPSGGKNTSQAAPVVPPSADALIGDKPTDPPLQAGDRVESLHAGRKGRVVRTYDDGSACVCWDDGEPQPEGLGHERMPRRLLILADRAPASATSPGDLAETAVNAARETVSEEEVAFDLPAVFSMVRGEFDGMEVTVMIHAGKPWMIALEIATVLGESTEESESILGVINQQFERAAIADAYALVRIASMKLSARLLDAQAINCLAVALDTAVARDLAAWMTALSTKAGVSATDERSASASGAGLAPEASIVEAGVSAINSAFGGLTLKDQFENLEALQRRVDQKLTYLDHLIGATRVVVDDYPNPSAKAIDVGTLMEIAAGVIEGYVDLYGDIEFGLRQIRSRVFEHAEPGRSMPESAWLDLVTALAAVGDSISIDDMSKFAGIANSLRGFASSSPEVAAALIALEAFTSRHGADLYYHSCGRMAFQWQPDRKPLKRPIQAAQAAPAHH